MNDESISRKHATLHVGASCLARRFRSDLRGALACRRRSPITTARPYEDAVIDDEVRHVDFDVDDRRARKT
jgi:hypothetical protein